MLVELLRARAPEAENTNDGRRKGDGRGGFGSGSRSNGGREVAGGGGGGGKRSGGGRRGDESLYPSVGLPSEIIDLRNHFHATPLHRAAAKGHEEVRGLFHVVSRFRRMSFRGRGRRGLGGGTHGIIHGRSRKTVGPRIPTMSGRSTSGFTGAGREQACRLLFCTSFSALAAAVPMRSGDRVPRFG